MKLTRTEELTLSLARGAEGKAGDGQMLTLLVAGVLAAANVRADVDLGLVLSAVCFLGILSVLERRNVCSIVRKLQTSQGGGD